MMNLAVAPTALYTPNVAKPLMATAVSTTPPAADSAVGDTFTPSQPMVAANRDGVNWKQIIPVALLAPILNMGLVACEEDGGKVAAPIAKDVLSRAVSCENNALVIRGFDSATPKAQPQGASWTKESEWTGTVDKTLEDAQKKQQAKDNNRLGGLLDDSTPTQSTVPTPQQKFITIIPLTQTKNDLIKCFDFQSAVQNKINQTETLNQPLAPGATKQITLNGVPVSLIGGKTDTTVRGGGQTVYIPN